MPHVHAPGLEHRFTIVAEVDPMVEMGQHKTENLVLVPITGGQVTGTLNGRVLPAGADWARLETTSELVHVEARYLVRTDTDTIIEVFNTGIGHRTNNDTEIGYFATRPIFRTSDPQLEWLHRAVFLGWASVVPGATTIEVFEVVAPEQN